jgi:hypothetical protein
LRAAGADLIGTTLLESRVQLLPLLEAAPLAKSPSRLPVSKPLKRR